MDIAAHVAAELQAVAAPFGAPRTTTVALLWGTLLAQLDPEVPTDSVVGIELVYEGYLCHYRESRCVALDIGDRAGTLLAGDCFYAHGLQRFAVHGDTDAVGVLSRLMAACSYLRSVDAPFAGDDALWAYTVGGLAAQRQGASPAVVVAPYTEIQAGFAGGAALDVVSSARAAAARLTLRDPAPLERALNAIAAGPPALASPVRAEVRLSAPPVIPNAGTRR